MRKRFVWDDKLKANVLVSQTEGVNSGPMIMPDIQPFISPVDGTLISGRAALRDHNKRHNVTNVADFTETWAKAAEERARAHTPGAGYDRKRRIERLKDSYERLEAEARRRR